jgi:hypothetical protein
MYKKITMFLLLVLASIFPVFFGANIHAADILPKQTIDFSVPNPSATGQFSLPLYQGAGYRPDFKTWSLLVSGGFMKFNLNISAAIPVKLTFNFCASLVDGVANCPVTITVNSKTLVQSYRDTNCNWHDKSFDIPQSLLCSGDNEIIISLDQSASTQMFIKAATVEQVILPKQTIDFSVPNPSATAQFSLPLYQGAGYRPDFQTWSLMRNSGFMKFNLNISDAIPVKLTFNFCASLVGGRANCPVTITVNSNTLVQSYRDTNCNWHDKSFDIPQSMLRSGDNEIIISLDKSASTQMFIKAATVEQAAQ